VATALEHYNAAEKILADTENLFGKQYMEAEVAAVFVAQAQVHATLALAAATALNVGEGGEDYERWRRTASVEAETLARQDAERAA
jgi:hypothetical protein